MTRKVNIGGLAGTGFAATIVLANVIAVPAGLPATGADIADVDAFFGAHHTALGVSSALTPLAWVLATVFGAGVVAATKHVWSLVGFAGIVLQNATFAGIVAVRLALAATSDRAALWALHDALFTLNGTFLALALTGLSVSGWRTGLIRRWHATLGFTSAALLFTSATLAPIHTGPLSLVGWLMWVVWLVAYGVTLQKRPAPAVREPASV